jgi:hypothetical protein
MEHLNGEEKRLLRDIKEDVEAEAEDNGLSIISKGKRNNNNKLITEYSNL